MIKSKKLAFLLLSASVLSCAGETEREIADSPGGDNPEIPRLMIQSGTDYLLRPVGELTENHKSPEHVDDESVIKFTFVEPAKNFEEIKSFDSGQIIYFSLDEDLSISAELNRNQAIGTDIRSLTASILDPYNGVITLSVHNTHISGNIDLVSENRLFHLRYDSLNQLHYLAEIDRSKLDVQEGAEPLETPGD